ncbi:hypothetical protein [Streptomyces sp. NPDC091416]|uniref:hypothetical protein n=1 Tax=Streptomyces sp. NPDC091416 TaxID=3366003 RepID=UPI0037F2D6D6
MSDTQFTAIGEALMALIPGARPETTRVTVEYAYAQLGHTGRDTWSGSLDGLANRIADALEKTTPAGAAVTPSHEARSTVLVALARALREQPTGAQILGGLDELGEASVCDEEPSVIASWVDALCHLARLDAAAAVAPVVYRAGHDSISCGLYTTPEAAQQHCEALVSREYPADVTVIFEWCVEDEDEALPGLELDVQVDGKHVSTGYTVTPLEVATAYDPDADE